MCCVEQCPALLGTSLSLPVTLQLSHLFYSAVFQSWKDDVCVLTLLYCSRALTMQWKSRRDRWCPPCRACSLLLSLHQDSQNTPEKSLVPLWGSRVSCQQVGAPGREEGSCGLAKLPCLAGAVPRGAAAPAPALGCASLCSSTPSTWGWLLALVSLRPHWGGGQGLASMSGFSRNHFLWTLQSLSLRVFQLSCSNSSVISKQKGSLLLYALLHVYLKSEGIRHLLGLWSKVFTCHRNNRRGQQGMHFTSSVQNVLFSFLSLRRT